MYLMRRNPLWDLMSMRRMMDRFSDDRWLDELDAGNDVQMDVSEDKDTFAVEADIPGFKPEDVDVSIDNNVLTIRGESTSSEKPAEGRHHHVRERTMTTSFVRSFTLPTEVDAEQAEASFDNGVLRLRLPKSQRTRRHQVPVMTGRHGERPSNQIGSPSASGGQMMGGQAGASAMPASDAASGKTGGETKEPSGSRPKKSEKKSEST